jgi:hypothetical protein
MYAYDCITLGLRPLLTAATPSSCPMNPQDWHRKWSLSGQFVLHHRHARQIGLAHDEPFALHVILLWVVPTLPMVGSTHNKLRQGDDVYLQSTVTVDSNDDFANQCVDRPILVLP